MKSIEKRMKIVEERVSRLQALSERYPTLAEYQASQDAKDIAERNLQVAIEASLDIAKIIIAREGLEEPKDNKGVFAVLAAAGILRKESLNALIPMAGTRNILVHSYEKIEDSLLYGILKKHMIDFKDFLREIRDGYLAGKSRPQ
jgi:uncharacterized protein YutE (UPF0331/DUF86 family)